MILIFPRRFKESLSILGSAITFTSILFLYLHQPLSFIYKGETIFLIDSLSSFILLFTALFGLLINIYSLGFLKEKAGKDYYTYLLWTISASMGVLISNHLILLLSFWGFLGLTLYLLINIEKSEEASAAAKKSLIIIGGSDCFLLLGIGLLWHLTGSPFLDQSSLGFSGGLTYLAFISFLVAALAKAGAMPFHTWIPDMAESSPASVTAFLPASLDKLLGIYLLVRISLSLFKMNWEMNLLLLIIGSFTIVSAVMMALIQHRMKRLLGYHAISQVGYMVLGIGTGNPIGIAGALFHMLNNAIYKSCLFLTAGAVKKRKGTDDLEKLGGLSRFMPLTFSAALIASLSISGVPPFNGFYSKWMIYQGIISLSQKGNLWIIWLVAAMFGSGLTLASFMKLIHTTFLGQPSTKEKVREVGWSMTVPMLILSFLCIVFGVLAFRLPLKFFIFPAIPEGGKFIGAWFPAKGALLLLLALLIGGLIYLFSKKKYREDLPYVGGEAYSDDMRVSGVEFYKTIKDIRPLSKIYNVAEKGLFDIYKVGRSITFYFVGMLRTLHSGSLLTYLSWVILGLLVLFLILIF